MAIMQSLIIVIAVIFCLFYTAAVAKTATFYKPPYTPSACYENKNKGVMIGAASKAIWDDGDACGRKYKVKCLGPTSNGDLHPCKGKGEVVVTIVDYCPGNCAGTIDLSREAFARIAHLSAGRIKVSLTQV